MTRVIPIRITPYERLVALARGGSVLSLGMFVLLRTLTIAFSWERYARGEVQLQERWAFFGAGLVITLLIVPIAFPLMRPAFARRASMTIADDWATIRRSGLLPEPLVFQHLDLREVLVGDLTPLKRGRGWLYPLLAAASIRPNIGLVFHGTVMAQGPIRGVKRWPLGGSSYLPAPGNRTSGLLLKLKDPEAAAAALRAWGRVGDMDPADLDPVKPTEFEWKSRRFLIYLGYAFIIGIAALHTFNVIADPLPDACDAQVFSCAEGSSE